MSERELFIAALQIDDEGERSAYLDEACAGKPELKNRVEALLIAHFETDQRLERPLVEHEIVGATIDSGSGGSAIEATGVLTPKPDGDPAPGPVTVEFRSRAKPSVLFAGRYTPQEKIGEGGMGEVWVAKQSEPVKRKVALKLIKPGMDSRAVLQRFEQERQALAILDHPNIAKVLDAGLTPGGQPFFVMELVNGLPLSKFCDELKLTPRERLELFVPICQAVQHAHQKGIVHRDLKPANILITMIDAKPVPKIIDFGVAKATAGKLTDLSLSTQFGAVIGTLEYMSPEQASFAGEDIDTRADIYSLGVILYELLTGLRPVDAARLKKAAFTEMIRIIQEEAPSKPSTRLSTNELLPSLAALRQIEPRKLMALLRGDLDWVVMKCLEKQRERRYETASALARDVQRYLDGDAVEACPPSVSYRMAKFLKRNKGPVLAASAVLLVLVAGIVGTTWGLFNAIQSRRAEKVQRTRAEAREEMAIDAVKKFRNAVANNPELKNDLALEPLRRTLLKEPLDFFKALRDRLQADRDTRPESLARLALASFDMGMLTEEIGDQQDALIAFQQSLAIRQKLADANPASTGFQSDLAASQGKVGLLLSETGKPAEALEAYESALAILQKLADVNPAITEFLYQLASTHNNIGLVLRATEKPADALKEHQTALAIRRKLADANPTVTEFQHVLAASHSNIGMVLSDTGKRGEAIEAHQKALAIWRKLADANPTAMRFQSSLAAGHDKIGALLRDTGKPAEALEAYESALAILQVLAEANPTNTDCRYRLASSHNNIGIVLKDTGRPGEALEAYESALAIQEKLADANPTVTQFQRDLANSHNNIGLLLSETDKRAKAMKAYESALAIRRKLADANPTVAHFQSDLASSYNNLGILLHDSDKPDEALKALESARTIYQKLVDANPTVIRYESELANSHYNFGAMLSEAGRPAAALRAYEAALPLREKLAREHPESPDYASSLGVTLQGIAKIQIDAGRFGAARDPLQQAIVCQKKALAINPRNPLYRDCLDRHLNNLIIAARGLRDAERVAEAERELAELRDSDPAMKALDARLAAIVKGDQQPNDNADRLQLAHRAYQKALHATAARLCAEAIAADPKLGDNVKSQHRYNAACAALLAAGGKSKDDPLPDDVAKTKLRRQALDWLKAEIAAWSQLVETGPSQEKPLIARILTDWKQVADLAFVRDEKELAKLPEAEHKEWQVLWGDVEALLKRIEGPKP